MRLKGKVAIITGAGRGIGFAGAQAFIREGAKVVIAEVSEELGRSAEAKLRALVARIDPARHPLYILLPKTEYEKLRESWKLP